MRHRPDSQDDADDVPARKSTDELTFTSETVECDGGMAHVFRLDGRIDAENAPKLQAKLMRELHLFEEKKEKHLKKIVINFEMVSYLSSAGIRVLHSLVNTMKHKKIECVMTNVEDHIQDILEISGFSKVFRIIADETGAL